jgi:MYXO-CTERM domain-containing protein
MIVLILTFLHVTTSATGITGLGTAQIGETVYAGSGSYGGLTVTNADTLVKYTYLGDADLSGSVDFDDYAYIDAGYGTGNRWSQGDFDNNGVVDFDDYAFIDGSYSGQGAPLLTANISAVPEPSTLVLGGLALLGFAGAGLRRRRLSVK